MIQISNQYLNIAEVKLSQKLKQLNRELNRKIIMHGFGNKKNKLKKIGMMIFKAEDLTNKLKEKNFMKQKGQIPWDLICKEKIQL